MSTRRKIPFWRTVLIGAGVIACFGLFELRAAHATCGDYLAHASKTMPPEKATSHQQVASPAASSDVQVPRRCPCRGAQCRQAPANSHQPVPAFPTTQGDKEFDCDAERLQFVFAKPVRRTLAAVCAEACIGFPDRIDHPPRA